MHPLATREQEVARSRNCHSALDNICHNCHNMIDLLNPVHCGINQKKYEHIWYKKSMSSRNYSTSKWSISWSLFLSPKTAVRSPWLWKSGKSGCTRERTWFLGSLFQRISSMGFIPKRLSRIWRGCTAIRVCGKAQQWPLCKLNFSFLSRIFSCVSRRACSTWD